MAFRTLLPALLLLAAVTASAAAAPAPRVLAFYYTWYGAPATSGAWRHWDEGGHHPDQRNAAGLTDIGATDHPPVLYDANDPATLRRHLAEARRAKIDTFISTWWARNDWHEIAFRKLLRQAEADLKPAKGQPTPRPVTLSLYYEVVPDAADQVAAATDDLLYLLHTFGGSPAFLRHAGKPVLFIYSRAVNQLTRAQWTEVSRRVKAKTPAYLVGDSVDPAWLDAFDTLHEYNPVGAVVAGEKMRPRYERIAAAARQRNRPALLTVIPGYDDSHIGRPTALIAPRGNGRLYARLWNAALDARPDWVLICSFNEWHEGSEIEPSVEYGDRFLRDTARYAAMLRTGRRAVTEAGDPTPRWPKGWSVEPGPESRISWETLPGGGLRVRNRSAGPATLRVKAPGAVEPYVFVEGKPNTPWRIMAPANPPGDSGETARRDDPFTYAVPTDATAQLWEGKAFALAQPDSPFAEMARAGWRVDLRSQWPGEEPGAWLAYPDGAFPLFVTLRNTGDRPLSGVRAEAWAPEGWSATKAAFPDAIPPHQSASVTLGARVAEQTPLGGPIPVFVFLKSAADPSFTLATSADFTPVRPVETRFTFGERGTMTLHLRNRFPGRTLTGAVTLRTAAGRSASLDPVPFTLKDEAELTLRQTLPPSEAPDLRRTYATLTIGGYRQLAAALDMATVTLGATDGEKGVEWVNTEDGLAPSVTGPQAPARRATPNIPGKPHYVYFNVADSLPPSGDTFVQAEVFDAGSGSLTLQYDSTDAKAPLEGAYKDAATVPLTNSGVWKTCSWTVSDARFAGRQNGGADFRLAMGPEEILVRRVTVSKWPLTSP